MDPEAIAIRLPPVKVGPDDLQGKSPLVIFTDQGMAGADLGDTLLPSGMRPERPKGASPQFAIEDAAIVLDRSVSMRWALGNGSPEPKLEHVRRIIGRWGDNFFPDARLSLVTLSSQSERIAIDRVGDMGALRKAVEEVDNRPGTNFSNALQIVRDCFTTAPAQATEGRKALIFITDGHDTASSRETAKLLAQQIRGTNAAVFVLGVGADYDVRNIIELTSHFGFAGWAHTPSNPGQGGMDILPHLLQDVRSAEHYLEVTAQKQLAGFYGLSPSIRRADNGVLYIGYQSEGVGICFTDSVDPGLQLHAKPFQSSSDVARTDIPVVEHDEAFAHYEKLGRARSVLGPLFVVLAQLSENRPLLERLRDEYPELRDNIAALLPSEDVRGAPETRVNERATMAHLGSIVTRPIMTHVNPLSMVNRDPPGREKEQGRHLHSGPLGPLDASVPLQVPTFHGADPDAYANAPVRGRASLSVTENGVVTHAFDLGGLPLGEIMLIGRSAACQIRLRDATVSRAHAQIRHTDKGFELSDLNSLSGTTVNDSPITTSRVLSSGDKIALGKSLLVFNT